MDVLALIVSALAALFAGGAAWYARGQKLAADQAAREAGRSADAAERSSHAAERSADAAERSADATQEAIEYKRAEAERDRVRFVLETLNRKTHRYLLRNEGTHSAYGVHMDAGEMPSEDKHRDFDEFKSLQAEGLVLIAYKGSGKTYIEVTYHLLPDRSDEPRRASLPVV